MSEVFEIKSSLGSYEVQLDLGQLTGGSLGALGDFVLMDENVEKLWLQIQPENRISIFATESNKTLLRAAQLIEELRACGANRSSHLVAFGGGIVQDLATVTASFYMRGIVWNYAPTTLLSMVDSCIGGKSSINVGPFKNIAGNYYPPKKILIDVRFCQTLARSELLAGLCEAVKICFAAKGNQLNTYLEYFSRPEDFLSECQLLNIVSLSLLTKKEFIEEDEFDMGPRLLLNFGHTFGHAIEAATQFSITHGLAVGFGMLAEIEFAKRIGGKSVSSVRVQKLTEHIDFLLSQIPEMKARIAGLDCMAAMLALRSDKKHQNDCYVIILPNSEGFLERRLVPINKEIDQVVLEVFEWLKTDLQREIAI